MKWLIASDLHGSSLDCRRLLDAFEREGAEKLVLLGDLLYHGPRNDFPAEYLPKAVFPALNERRAQIVCVRGNCDSEVDQMVLDFPILADYCLLPLGGRTVFLTHGHVYHTGALPPLQPGDILLHGHTHIPAWEPFGEGNYYLNPGSLALPKPGWRRSYLLLEDGVFTWKALEDGAAFHELAL